MTSTTLKTRIKLKNGTPEEWSQATNFSPLKGELIIYNDANNPKMKVGDGETNINDLPFVNNSVVAADLSDVEDGTEFDPVIINADSLGGIAAADYATKVYVDDAISNLDTSNINLDNYYTKAETDSAIESAKPDLTLYALKTDAAPDSEKLGGVAADQYALKNGEVTYNQIVLPDGNRWNGEIIATIDAVKVAFSTTLAAANWSETAPYSQTIIVEGITENDKPYIFVDLSTATEDTVDSIEAEWAKVKYALTSENTITFYCIKETPAIDISIEGEVAKMDANYISAKGVKF